MILNWFPQRPDHLLADPRELKRVLGELLVAKPAQGVEEVLGWFDSLRDATSFRLDQWFDIVRQLDEAAQPHLLRQARDYLHRERLTKVEEEGLWTTNYGYWQALAALCAEAVERAQADPKSRNTEAFKPSLPLALVRLQAARIGQMRWRAYRYGPPDEDLWRGLAQTYLETEASGLASKSLAIYPAMRAHSSVLHQYVHALVFATSSMDSLLPWQIALADRLIAHFLQAFAFGSERRPDSTYWVDTTSGTGPVRLLRQPGNARPGLRFLAPANARQGVEELIHKVERGDIPGDLNLGGQFAPRALLSVLRHLHTHWATRPPQRKHQRHAVKTRMTVWYGFERSYQIFLGGRANADAAAESESWVVDSLSLGGFRACIGNAPGDPVRLGGLLCVQPEGSDKCLLAAARRFNRLNGKSATLGVQLLSKDAKAVELRPRRSGFAASIVRGIWLYSDGDGQQTRIVLPLGSFSVRAAVEFVDQAGTHVLTPLEVEESGNDYEIARYHGEIG